MTIDEEFLVQAAKKRRRLNLFLACVLVAMVVAGVLFVTGVFHEYARLTHGLGVACLLGFGAIYYFLLREPKKKR